MIMFPTKPGGDKGIVANRVILKDYIIEAMRREFRGINDIERASTEVGFQIKHELDPMKFGI